VAFATKIGRIESGNRDFYSSGAPVVSHKGARYAMQVMPATARNPGFGVKPAQNNSPAEYNRVGNDYLSAMQSRYGSADKAAAAYNAGPGRVDKALSMGADWLGGLPLETQRYVARLRARGGL
jgi:soluble lytic murein transglycosylase